MTGNTQELEQEIERLRSELVGLRDMKRVCNGLLEAGLFSQLSMPSTHSNLCESIVQTAELLTGSEASGLFLLDQKTQELVAMVVRGGGGEDLKNFRIPLDQGLVGYCATTGEVILIENAGQDERWSSDLGQLLGYTPRSVLCVPMIAREEVVGVLQILDKTVGTFGPQDIELAGHFAAMAAIAVQQYGVIDHLALIVRHSLTTPDEPPNALIEELERQTTRIATNEDCQEMLEIAATLNRIYQHGDNARRMSRRFLKAIENYLETLHPA